MADVSTSHARQKRVLPTRSRRGGPGIGSCDVDLMILEAQKRRFDNEPLIPADTPFLLTTNAALLQPLSNSSSFGLNTFANQRYFDRPDVIKAYREQLNIQTPEFSLLSEDATVGGRFRPRSSGEDNADTSDATYEKRHRKYEIFEKRQRLREKEQLKHEQYKLRERIEQLRVMDSSAFLGLPAASFSAPPTSDGDKESEASLSGTQMDGDSVHDEGDRRREEMLRIASTLEERYKTLLPSEKKLADLKGANRSTSANPQISDVRSSEEPSATAKALPASPKPNAPSIILKIKVPQTRHSLPSFQASSPGLHSNSVYTPTKPFSKVSSDTLSVSSDRPYKRYRTSRFDDADSLASTDSPEYGTNSPPSAASKTEPCVLMQWAIRNQAAPNVRKTQRHVTAFGTKVPPSIEEMRDFELPEWIRPRSPTVVSDGPKDPDALPEHSSPPTLHPAQLPSQS